MRRALELAQKGLGTVSPNPMVGAVLVRDGRILGEGYHKRYGGPHAEIEAIQSVPEANSLIGSSLYVTLEPCNHQGKTPPCTEAIIRAGIRKVYVGCIDPNPLVAGTGIARLRAAGIEVSTGVQEAACVEQNGRFFTYMQKKRPYVILKWAQNETGLMASIPQQRTPISGKHALKLVHQWRSQEDAILVGYQTALIDNPELNVRFWKGRNPIRVVLDPQSQLPKHLHVFDQKQATLVLHQGPDSSQGVLQYKHLARFSAIEILALLYQLGVQSVLIEGGRKTLDLFLEHNLWDEVRVLHGMANIPKGIAAPVLNQKPSYTYTVATDTIYHYINRL